ncbi:ADP-ribosylglycohydrolase [Anaerocolumna jejuensis DSM 15929]|uniref:ADP-ribosylglycohydrolase n=1 Tax=Anaerocolumna jejuensis DSM 15929 TaxID=1121322 RepID=A0A1M6ZU93_9FIRM|nr:ADP-ribosylglycohydrolase family protein [Anaerocolumna jejuensis]SHL34057.1 ADP-ribosylglycohydrolase [Anaerocolumna jejuensis DSM 15929]
MEKEKLSSVKHLEGTPLYCEKYKEESKLNYVMHARRECPFYNSNNPIKVEKTNDLRNKLNGGLFGFCIGDALGVPVEFSSREERQMDPVNEMRAYGTHHQPFGTWSDDTSLMLCLIEAINHGYSIKSVADNFVKYYTKGYLTPYGEVFDIGISTRIAIEKLHAGINPIECGGKAESDNGNGSLMRILPLAFYGRNMNAGDLIKMIEEVSALTHAHKRSKLACIFYTVYAIQIISGNNKKDAYEITINFITDNCSEKYSDEFGNYKSILSREVLKYNVSQIKSSGYVIDTLEAVLWSFLISDNYKDAVLKAVNLGGDTDTIAAIAGGLAGIYYGFDSIPDKWVQGIVRKEELYDIFTQFSSLLE